MIRTFLFSLTLYFSGVSPSWAFKKVCDWSSSPAMTADLNVSSAKTCPNQSVSVFLDHVEDKDSFQCHYEREPSDNPDDHQPPNESGTAGDVVNTAWQNPPAGFDALANRFTTDEPGDYQFVSTVEDVAPLVSSPDTGTRDDFDFTRTQSVTVDPFRWSPADPIGGTLTGPQPSEVDEEQTAEFSILDLKDPDVRSCGGVDDPPVNHDVTTKWTVTPAEGDTVSQSTANFVWRAPKLKGNTSKIFTITAQVDDKPVLLAHNETGITDDAASLILTRGITVNMPCTLDNIRPPIVQGNTQLLHNTQATFNASISNKAGKDCTSHFNITWSSKEGGQVSQIGTGNPITFGANLPPGLPCGADKNVKAQLLLQVEQNGSARNFIGPPFTVSKGQVVKVENTPDGKFKVTYSTGYVEICDKSPKTKP